MCDPRAIQGRSKGDPRVGARSSRFDRPSPPLQAGPSWPIDKPWALLVLHKTLTLRGWPLIRLLGRSKNGAGGGVSLSVVLR